MADQPDNHTSVSDEEVDADRRDFLRTSVYAAYATPLITTLLVTEKAAAGSCENRCYDKFKNPNALANCLSKCGPG